MKKKSIVIINLIVAILIAAFAIGYAFAWMGKDLRDKNYKFGGSSASSYFAGGTGTQDDPYTITNKYHVYNLAWLQDTGRFGNDKYYFALDGDVQMDDMWVPPIGTDAEPFIGEFDGRGHTISGLKVTTNRDKLTSCPVVNNAGFQFSRAVGFFGFTENKSSEDKTRIQNFILANPLVEVAVTNAPYSTASNCVAGLAVGHVSGVVSSIGILATEVSGDAQGTELDIFVASDGLKYSTFNSILGELAEGASSTVTGGGHLGGDASGAGGNFGNTFDISILYSRLENIALAKYGKAECKKNETLTVNAAAWRLPSLDNSSSNWTLAKGDKLAFAKTGDHYSDAEPYEEVANDSTGYFLGNQTKIQQKKLTYAKPLTLSDDRTYYYATDAKGNTGSPYELKVIPNWLYTQPNDWQNSDYQVGFGFAPVSQATFENLPKGIKDLVDFKPTESGSFTTVRVQADYTQTVPSAGRWQQLTDTSWSYHGQITWNGNTYGVGLKSDPYDTKNQYSYPIDEYGHKYTYDGYLTDENNYKLNEDYSYVINTNRWDTPVFALNSQGQAILQKGGKDYSYYVDQNLIDENNYLFNFEGDERRYVSALEGWALPIYGVNSNGYALDENGNRYSVNAFYELDENGFYKRANGTYVIKTAGWDTPIYVVDEDGYALTEDGGQYYTTTVGVYQKDGTCKYYDENGYSLVLVDGEYIRPYGYDADGYAVNASGFYYTATAGSFLKYENGAYYRVDENGNKQIDDNGRIVTPYGFDADGYAVNEEGFYYNSKDTNIFYDKRPGQWGPVYYEVSKSATAGNIWTYVLKSGSAVVTKIDDNGYAMYNDEWRYTTTDDIYADSNGYNLHGDGGYIMDTTQTWYFVNGETAIAYFGDDGILYADANCTRPQYVKGAYYVDTRGYAVTSTGAYALDESNNITGDKIPYHVNSNGQLTYSTGPDAGQKVTFICHWGSEIEFVAVKDGYSKIQASTGSADNLATAITGTADDRIQQAEGTLADRVQATHDSDFTDNYVTVKTAEGNARPTGVTGDVGPFHQMMGGILLPNNGVWFKPAKAGMIRFVMYADTPMQNFVLLKIERQLHADGTVSFDDTITNVNKVLQQQLPANVLFYYEYEVSQADIEAGNVEFVIMRDNTDTTGVGGSFLLYLDLGASALSDGDDDVSTVNPDVDVSAVDFIYQGVTINQDPDLGNGIKLGDFIVGGVLYEASKTSIYFEQLENTLKIVYVRLHNQPNGETIKVSAINAESGQPSDEIESTRPQYSLINE